METFARLDPRDVSVSALMLPALVGFLDNCCDENREHERLQYRQQIEQEFQLLSPPKEEYPQPIAPVTPTPQYHTMSPLPNPVMPSPQPHTSTPIQTPVQNLVPIDAKPIIVTVAPESGDSKSAPRTLFNL